MRTLSMRYIQYALLPLFAALCFQPVAVGEPADTQPDSKVVEKKNEPAVSKPLPIEQQRYRVKIVLSLSETIFNTEKDRTRFQTRTSDEIHRLFGPIWDVEMTTQIDHSPNDSFSSKSNTRKRDAWYQSLIKTEGNFHKSFIVRVTKSDNHQLVSAREWDARSETWGPVVKSKFLDSTWTVSEIGKQIENAFRPVCLVVRDRIEGDPSSKKVYMRLQAGEFSTPSDSVKQLVKGDLLSPVLLYLGRSQGAGKEREVRRRQPVNWTYIEIESVDNGRVVGRPFSTYRVPISKPQTRLKTIALRIRPWHNSTKIKLVRRNTGQGVGSLIVRISKRNPETEKYEIQESLISNREGWVELKTNSEDLRTLKWLNVVSGESLIAKVPYLLGENDNIILKLPDDRVRLQVEGQLTRLRNELTELVAKRAVLIHRIKTLAKQEKWESVDKLVKEELEKIPDKAEFLVQVNAIRIPAIEAARKQRDRGAEIRIASLCRKAEDLIKRYLKEDKKSFLLQELKELREISENKS